MELIRLSWKLLHFKSSIIYKRRIKGIMWSLWVAKRIIIIRVPSAVKLWSSVNLMYLRKLPRKLRTLEELSQASVLAINLRISLLLSNKPLRSHLAWIDRLRNMIDLGHSYSISNNPVWIIRSSKNKYHLWKTNITTTMRFINSSCISSNQWCSVARLTLRGKLPEIQLMHLNLRWWLWANLMRIHFLMFSLENSKNSANLSSTSQRTTIRILRYACSPPL